MTFPRRTLAAVITGCATAFIAHVAHGAPPPPTPTPTTTTTTAQAPAAPAPPTTGCSALPDYAKLRDAVRAVVREGKQANTGMGNEEWAAIVDRDGIVCAIAFSGNQRSDQWPG